MPVAAVRDDTDALMREAAAFIKELERDLAQARAAHALSENEVRTLQAKLKEAQGRSSPDLVREGEALFGLVAPYTREDLKGRFMALMKRVHPDVAGPNGVAQRLNAARDSIAKRHGWL